MKWYGCDVALNLQTTRYKFTARMAIRMNIPLSDSGETPAVQLSMKEPGRFISWSRRAMLSDIAKDKPLRMAQPPAQGFEINELVGVV